MKKAKIKKLIKLVDEWTRAEAMARFGRFDNLEYIDYFVIKINKENEIRKLLYGTDSLVTIGEKKGLITKANKQNKQARARHKRKTKSKQGKRKVK